MRHVMNRWSTSFVCWRVLGAECRCTCPVQIQ